MPEADPPPLWGERQNIVAAMGRMGPSGGEKVKIPKIAENSPQIALK